jgi:large subunit ribosomal protein L22
METKASLRSIRLSAQKGRLVADQIRGLPVDKALNVLNFSSHRAAGVIKKLLESAIANAEHNDGADIDELRVRSVFVERGTFLRRFRPGPKGRAMRITKPTCHIYVSVGD